MIEIDGSFGEGGGSIIRLAVALSAITEKPCKIFNIRAKRGNPGLRPQHLTAVKAMSKLCDAVLKGDNEGSRELEFYPKKITTKSLNVNVGTAGSTPLVLQSLMIPASHTDIDIKITGGTMVRWSPTIGYLQNVTLPILKKFGFKGNVILHRHGFYPKGGGLIEAKIQKSDIKRIEIMKKGKVMHVYGRCTISRDLEKANVAERMQKTVRSQLFKEFGIQPEIKCEYVESLSTGGGIDLFVVYENSIIGSNALAEPGKKSEKVAKEALNFLIEQHSSVGSVDEHLEDQLIPYIALAGGKIKVPKITNHTRTNIWVCEKFLPVKFEINEDEKIISCE